MVREKLENNLRKYIRDREFMSATGVGHRAELEFLAQGENNINYIIKDGAERHLLRLSLKAEAAAESIEKEFSVLETLALTGVTPRPFYLDLSREKVDYPLLMTEYIEGKALDYQDDLKEAAQTLAKIHKIEPENKDLKRETKPLTALWEQATKNLEGYFASNLALPEVKEFLEKIKTELAEKREKEEELMELLPLAIVNNEVNSEDFIVKNEFKLAYLVDWEQALITTPLQDLSRFMLPTNTLWKTNFIFNQGEEEEFLHHYLKERGIDSKYYQVKSALRDFNKFTAFLDVSWAAKTWFEYQTALREIENQEAIENIEGFLEPNFLELLFPDLN